VPPEVRVCYFLKIFEKYAIWCIGILHKLFCSHQLSYLLTFYSGKQNLRPPGPLQRLCPWTQLGYFCHLDFPGKIINTPVNVFHYALKICLWRCPIYVCRGSCLNYALGWRRLVYKYSITTVVNKAIRSFATLSLKENTSVWYLSLVATC